VADFMVVVAKTSPEAIAFRVKNGGVFRGLKLCVSEFDSVFDIFDGGFENDLSELSEPGSGSNRVIKTPT
jgi:hypothetical protein